MESRPNLPLIAGALLSVAAATVHAACLTYGAPLYRMLGAGDDMVRMAGRGEMLPAAVSLTLAAGIAAAAVYAFSGAGMLRRLPFARTVLCLVTAVYLFRGIGFGVFVPLFPENPFGFWMWSSAFSLLAGLLHYAGLRRAWADLEPPRSDLLAY
ncbi:hypothetical protein [Lysobacter sp.]|uniref:hypothetical protein n=1 Tax=Lysobacter sp. TaxID=72226 RepID=UPI002D4CBC0D|nr:hypothetical protein [Lysobacter sp.]HZX77593.1 hypothetical protein [Lysobacter sp.]